METDKLRSTKAYQAAQPRTALDSLHRIFTARRMTDEDFRETLEVFAECAMQHKAKRLVIDLRKFKHRPSPEILAWRDHVTVGKYNEAGVEKQAWIRPGDVSSRKP